MKLIFLTYINRSGSTFLANMFSKSPDVLVCPEGEVIMNELLVNPGQTFDFSKTNKDKFYKYFKSDLKLKHWKLSEDILNNLPEDIINYEVFVWILKSYKNQIKPEASIILFKAERLIHLFQNMMPWALLNDVFFISFIRDCRGVYASQKRTKFPDTDKYMSRNPVQTAMNWKKHVKKALEMQKVGRLELIRFEELLIDPGKVFSKLLEKLDIPFFEYKENPGDLYDRLPEKHRVIHEGILKEPDREKIDNWKYTLNNTELYILEMTAGKSLLVFYKRLDKQFCPVIIRPVQGYYFMKYIFSKMTKKLHFYRRNRFFYSERNTISQ